MQFSGEQSSIAVFEAQPHPDELCIVRIAIWYGNLLLFVQRHDGSGNYNGYLEFPGGKDEDCKNSYEQVIRETWEETQLLVEPLQCPPMEHRYKMKRPQNKYVKRIIYTKLYQAVIPPDQCLREMVTLSPDEHSSFVLMSPEEMIKRHNNNRGARVHKGTSFALPFLEKQGNPSFPQIITR
jgi:8-oxo-dGTP pyrophosphatase MutT (NUDIX family)